MFDSLGLSDVIYAIVKKQMNNLNILDDENQYLRTIILNALKLLDQIENEILNNLRDIALVDV